MRPRLVVRRAALPTRLNPRSLRIRPFTTQSQPAGIKARPSLRCLFKPTSTPIRLFTTQSHLTNAKARPSLPFLSPPTNSPVRHFTSARRQWLRHEAKLVVRYTVTIWGTVACVLLIVFAVSEEALERQFPTPPEWNFLTRKILRDAHNHKDPKNGEVNWARALELAREVVIRLDRERAVIKLSDKEDPSLEVPDEFLNRDISAMSEEWRRGYFEAIMLAAKAAEHVDGWVRDVTRNVVSPPEFVIGPSNPRPRPIPSGNPHAPREENCVIAYPVADNWYMKILASKGLSARQKMEAALEYASFMEYKQRPEGPDALYNLALAEVTTGLDPANLPYDPKSFILKDKTGPPSLNVLDAITAIANHKARRGDVSGALPIYLSLLKARRALPNDPPRVRGTKSKRVPFYRKVIEFVAPPDYPPPPPDGGQPPWRSPEERCHEASLSVYIGEIMYATASRDDGLAWTRDGVDIAEEQLRSLDETNKDKIPRQVCRECLTTGLGNWATMVTRLAKEEAVKRETKASSASMFSFWNGSQDEGRWAAEEGVVRERVRRTRELMEDLTPPPAGPFAFFKV